MISALPPLVAAGVPPEERDAIDRALRRIAPTEFIALQQLGPYLDTGRSASGFLIALWPRDRMQIEDWIRRLHRARAATPIIALVRMVGEWPNQVVGAVRAGASHFALDDIDSLHNVVARALGDLQITAACAQTARHVIPLMPRAAHSTIEFCTMNAARPLAVLDVANAVRLHPRSLHRLLHRLALPSPSATISWCRLFVAVHMLSSGAQRVDHIATTLGYASGSGLRNMLRRYCGLTTSGTRENGSLIHLARLYRSGDLSGRGQDVIQNVDPREQALAHAAVL